MPSQPPSPPHSSSLQEVSPPRPMPGVAACNPPQPCNILGSQTQTRSFPLGFQAFLSSGRFLPQPYSCNDDQIEKRRERKLRPGHERAFALITENKQDSRKPGRPCQLQLQDSPRESHTFALFKCSHPKDLRPFENLELDSGNIGCILSL